MTISILTLFPEMFTSPFSASILKRAQNRKLIKFNLINIREFATDQYRTVDDHPYGGGVGMILRVDVVARALQHVNQQLTTDNQRTILLDPQGVPYTQKKAQELSNLGHLILVCGHYEGIDERIRSLVDSEVSIGDYVLSGGEVPAMVIVDSVVRLLSGVLKKPEATRVESFTRRLLEYPQYTRPPTYAGLTVPAVLLSGDHAKIAAWRDTQARLRTRKRRPDLVTTKGRKDQV